MKKIVILFLTISVLFLSSCTSKKLKLPDLEGVYLPDAKEILNELKLIPAMKFEESDDENNGNVIRTIPEKGTELEAYSRVELYIGR